MPDLEIIPADQDSTHMLRPEDKAFIAQFMEKVRPSADPDMTNRTTGMVLIILNEICKIPLATAWRMVRPNSDSTGHNAETQASRRIKWFRQRYPLNLQEGAEVNGITIEFVWDRIRTLMSAKKALWNPKTEKHEVSDIDDMVAIKAGIAEYRAMLELDKIVRKEAVMGKSEVKTRLNLPPKDVNIQEWERWAQSQEAEVLAERTKATEEMRALAEAAKLQRESGGKITSPDELLG